MFAEPQLFYPAVSIHRRVNKLKQVQNIGRANTLDDHRVVFVLGRLGEQNTKVAKKVKAVDEPAKEGARSRLKEAAPASLHRTADLMEGEPPTPPLPADCYRPASYWCTLKTRLQSENSRVGKAFQLQLKVDKHFVCCDGCFLFLPGRDRGAEISQLSQNDRSVRSVLSHPLLMQAAGQRVRHAVLDWGERIKVKRGKNSVHVILSPHKFWLLASCTMKSTSYRNGRGVLQALRVAKGGCSTTRPGVACGKRRVMQQHDATLLCLTSFDSYLFRLDMSTPTRSAHGTRVPNTSYVPNCWRNVKSFAYRNTKPQVAATLRYATASVSIAAIAWGGKSGLQLQLQRGRPSDLELVSRLLRDPVGACVLLGITPSRHPLHERLLVSEGGGK
ncbi:hypothetical protein J6590_036083 [Homalodisca vitripennis]|nr:hypothetical protein J6590_036083 [Homalodisca vitripennis]